jgi:hypothetical protein
MSDYSDTENNSTIYETKIRKLLKDLDQCYKELERKDTHIQECQMERNVLKNEISQLKKQVYQVEKEGRDKDKYIKIKDEEIAQLQDKIGCLKKRIQELSSSNIIDSIEMSTSLESLIATVRGLINSLENHILYNTPLPDNGRQQITRSKAILGEIQNKYNEKSIQLSECQQNHQENTIEIRSLREQERVLRENISTLQRENEMHIEEKGDLQRYSEELYRKCIEYETRAEARELEIKQLEKNITKLEDDLTKKDKYADKLARKAVEFQDQLHDCKRKLKPLENCRNEKAMAEYWRDWLEILYRNKKDKVKNLRQIILNLQNNINPQNQNMATIQDVMNALAPIVAQIPTYIGQEPPDDYLNKVEQTFAYGTALGGNAFTDAVKTNILSSKMGGKYAPVPQAYPVGTNVDTPARFRAWLRHRYHQITQGTRSATISKLATEKFLPNDTPETYEDRIRLLLLETPNNDESALALLWNHLPDELFNRVKSERPNANDIDAFFQTVRNCYLERKPTTFTYNNNNISSTLANLLAKPGNTQKNADLDEALDLIHQVAVEYGYPDDGPKDFKAMKLQIDYEGGKHGYNIMRQSKSGYAMKKKPPVSKKPRKIIRHCSQCGSTKHTKNYHTIKRKPKRMNYGYIEDDQNEEEEDDEDEEEYEEEVDDEDDEENSEEEYEPKHFNAGKKKDQNGSLLLLGDQGYRWN